MTTIEGGEAADVTTEAAREAAVSSQERDYETEASEQGWRPKEEWSGKPENWKDAKTYVEWGDANNRVSRVEQEVAKRVSKIEKMFEKSNALLKREYERDVASIKAAQKEAAKAGDDKEYDRLEQMKEGLEKPDTSAPVDINDAFAQKHDWYGTDDELTAIAIGFSQDVLSAAEKAGKDMTMDDMFDAVAKRIEKTAAYKAKFPEKTRGANGHAPVDGGSENPSGRHKDGKTFADLPAEAKRAYDKFDPRIKKEMPKEQYAKEYFDA